MPHPCAFFLRKGRRPRTSNRQFSRRENTKIAQGETLGSPHPCGRRPVGPVRNPRLQSHLQIISPVECTIKAGGDSPGPGQFPIAAFPASHDERKTQMCIRDRSNTMLTRWARCGARSRTQASMSLKEKPTSSSAQIHRCEKRRPAKMNTDPPGFRTRNHSAAVSYTHLDVYKRQR